MKFLSKRRIWLVIILFFLTAGLLLPVWNRGDSTEVGYTTPTDLTVYGITGHEAVYSFSEYMNLDSKSVKEIEISVFETSEETNASKHALLSLTRNTEIRSCLDLLDRSFEIVDIPAKYCVQYRFGTWPPYTFTFKMNDGTLRSCAISIIDEPSRIIETDDGYHEMLAVDEVFTQLQEAYGMASYPDLFEANRTEFW